MVLGLRKAVRDLGNTLKSTFKPFHFEEVKLFDFAAGALASHKWTVITDASYGGTSRASLQESDEGKWVVFEGELDSTSEVDSDAKLRRGAFCFFRTREYFPGERDQAFNLEDYNSLRLRVRGDGRTYLTSMRPDNFLIPPEQNQDLWQAQVRTSGNGEWEEVEIPLVDFVMTHQGRVLESPGDVRPAKVISFGMAASALADNSKQPFRIEIEWISARP
mmetsp:Transcript_12008/g.43842  ORF Transcript_12008/g.43842 Transcript_12008/m.43842 type:complete len:219 (-) Transcript_12008:265-921(-)